MIDRNLIKKAEQRAFKSYEELKNTRPIPVPKTASEVGKERIAERQLEKISPKTGYPDLDRLIKGFIPGHLYTLTGETNVGKTSVACNFAVNVAKQGKKVLYVSLEPGNMLAEYLASILFGKSFDDVSEEELLLSNVQLEILGKEDVESSERMVEIVENLERYDLVVVDHVGYFINSENNYLQQQSNTVKRFVTVAKKKRCAVILIAHLRKKAKNEKRSYVPSADDISGSGAFKQDSTEVLIVTRQMLTDDKDEIRHANTGKIIVAKSKSGPNGMIDIVFSSKSAKIMSEGEMYEGPSIVDAAKEVFGS